MFLNSSLRMGALIVLLLLLVLARDSDYDYEHESEGSKALERMDRSDANSLF